MTVQLPPSMEQRDAQARGIVKNTMVAGGIGGLALILATSLIARYEGLVQKPYRDPVGILTVCYGHTGKDIEQRRYSKAECTAMLQKDIQRHVPKCLTVPLTEMQQAAFVSLAYNIGVGAFCKSPAFKAAQSGDMATACKKIELHRKAGGKVLPGLVKRRAFERALCEGDSSKAADLIMNSGDVFPAADISAEEAIDILEDAK